MEKTRMRLRSYPYSSTVISSRVGNLLTKEAVMGAAANEAADSVMMSLREKGYARGGPEMDNPYQFETIVSYELKKTIEFLKEISPNEELLDLFLLKYDYLNLKTLLKLNLKGQPFSEQDITPYGMVSFDLLKESIDTKVYDRLPTEMADALKRLDKTFVVNEDASMIGLILDQAYASQVARMIKDEKNPIVHAYFSAFFDFTNIITALRMKAGDYRSETVQMALLDGGRLRKSDVLRAYEDAGENAFRQFLKFGYEKYLSEALEIYESGGGLFAVEKARDDYLMAALKKDRYDVFSSSRAVGFLIAKEREAAAVRLLMVSVLNHIGAEEVARRLKDLYY